MSGSQLHYPPSLPSLTLETQLLLLVSDQEGDDKDKEDDKEGDDHGDD